MRIFFFHEKTDRDRPIFRITFKILSFQILPISAIQKRIIPLIRPFPPFAVSETVLQILLFTRDRNRGKKSRGTLLLHRVERERV